VILHTPFLLRAVAQSNGYSSLFGNWEAVCFASNFLQPAKVSFSGLIQPRQHISPPGVWIFHPGRPLTMAGDVWLENWSWRNRRAGCVVDPRDVSDDDESCRARIIRRRRRCWDRRMDLDHALWRSKQCRPGLRAVRFSIRDGLIDRSPLP